MTVFTLGSISFNTGSPDSDGIVWYGRVEGWDEISNRTEAVGRPAQHGGITLSNFYDARQMTVFGTAVGENITDYYLAKNKIANETNMLTPFASPELVLVHAEDVSKQMVVVRTSLKTMCIDELHLQFEMTLRADNPFKYAYAASALTTSGTAVNAGNVATPPAFTLSSSGAPVLTLGARTVAAVASLPAGTVVNFYRMTVLDGGTNYFGSMDPASDFFDLAPGNNSVASTVAGTWSWRSAWL